MSTKTSLLKRIAQTAVVALVTGLLSFVAVPASNANQDPAISGTCVARAGVGGILNISTTGQVARNTGAASGVGYTVRAKEIARTAVAGAASGVTTLQTAILESGIPETGTSAIVLPIDGDSLTVGLATITYSVWTDNRTNADDSSAPGALSSSTTVVCTVAGAPASFALSSTTASVANGESATITITPKDSAGVTTLFAAVTESFTVSASSDSTGVVTMVSGKGAGGIVAPAKFAGASYVAAGAIAGTGVAGANDFAAALLLLRLLRQLTTVQLRWY